VGVEAKLDLALRHLLPRVKSTPLNLLRAKNTTDALRTMICCCSWVTGNDGDIYWCGNNEGISIWRWKKGYGREEVTVPWKTALVHAHESGILVDLILDTYESFGMYRADHLRWRTMHPYGMLTTPGAIRDEARRRGWDDPAPPGEQPDAPIPPTPDHHPKQSSRGYHPRRRPRQRR